MSDDLETMGGLTQREVWAFAADWYRKLDEHVPAAEIVPMVADAGLEFYLPEGVLRGRDAFRQWYEGVITLFFDEVHTLRSVGVASLGDGAECKVVVNWQARRWRPPAPRSEWIGFDAYQTWQMVRSPAGGQPLITRYVVDELRPMPGSPPL
jgi:hypothetical protein